MQHMGQKHGGQQLLPESVGQLRRLDRAACVVCGTIRSQQCNRCGLCQSNTPLRELRVGDTFSGPTTTGTSECSAWRPPISNPPLSLSQCPPDDPLDDIPQPHSGHCPRRARQAAARRALPSLRNCTPAMRGLSIRHGLGRKPRRSHERSPVLGAALSLPLSPVLAGIPKGVDRNAELKLQLHLWETGQISDLISKVMGQQNSGPLRKKARRVQLQTDEQRGKRACAFTARGSNCTAMKGLVGGAAQGSAD